MSDAQTRNADELAYWNGEGGVHWVKQQAHTDAVLAPVADAVIAHAAPRSGERVLDIGCGCGSTTLLLSPLASHVTGLDISEPMLNVARQRAEGLANVDFVNADAAAFRTDTPYDLLFSRFGVMFFGDPTAAFANLRRAARPGGRLAFVCWRPIGENPWMQAPLHAAYNAGVPRLPKPGPEDPGPFAFAGPERVTRVLTGAGWSAPSFTKFDTPLDIAAGQGIEAALDQATQIGAASRALREAPDELRAPAIAAIRATLEAHRDGDSVRLGGGMWLVSSTA